MTEKQDITSPFVLSDTHKIDFRQMFSSLSVMFYVENFEPEYHLEYLSPAFESLGYSLEEIYARPKILDEVMHPEDFLMMKEANKPVYQQQQIETDYEYRVYKKNGEMRWWMDRGRPIFNDKGERIKWFGVISDITDQKNAEKNLLESNETTQAILESVGDLLVVVDDDGLIEMVNDSAASMLGYEKNYFIGKHIRMLTQKKTFLTPDEFKTMLENRHLLGVRKDFVRNDGTILQVSISSSVRIDHKQGAVIVAKDIRKQIEDEQKLRLYANDLEQSNLQIRKARKEIEKSNKKLVESNRELEDFAYIASHDLQEPLRKVQAFGDRLEKKFSDKLGDEGRDYIERMRNAADRMQTLIHDLLTLSRISTKCHPFETVDISEIAKDVLSDLEVRIAETDAKIEIEDLPVIDADPLQMRQLLQNLIGNALKFQRPGETPHIKITSDFINESTGDLKLNGVDLSTNNAGKKFCSITVQDNGIGFEEKYLNKIFTVFQRLHGRGSYEGSGIGLSVCRKIVERHNGEITARSQPEQGATFFVTLPVKQIQKEI